MRWDESSNTWKPSSSIIEDSPVTCEFIIPRLEIGVTDHEGTQEAQSDDQGVSQSKAVYEEYRVAIRIGTSNEEVWKGDHDNFQREYEVHPLIPEVVQFKDWRELNSYGLSGESIVVRGSGVSEDGRENAVLRDARVDLPEMDYRIQPNFTSIGLREGRRGGKSWWNSAVVLVRSLRYL